MRVARHQALNAVCSLLLVVGAPDPAPAQQTSKPGPPIAITNVTVIDVTSGAELRGRTVLVRGNRIATIGRSSRVPVPRGATIVSGRGKYLIPGLWDMHSHAGSYGDTTGAPALALSLAHGVTGVRDVGARSVEGALGWRDAIAAGRMLGPRMKVASPIVEHPRWLATVIGWEEKAGKPTDDLRLRFGPTTAEQAIHFVDSMARIGVDHIKVRNWPAPPVSEALVQRAREVGLPVVAHGNRPFPRRGVASIEHGVHPSPAHGAPLLDTLYRQWAVDGVVVVPTLVASIGRRHSPDTLLAWWKPERDRKYAWVPAEILTEWRQELEVAEANEAPRDYEADYRGTLLELREMRKHGIRILAASDFGGPGVVPGVDLLLELSNLVSDVGMSPLEALQAATIHPAELLRMRDSLGTIAPGMIADLVLLDANPLHDIRNTTRIRAVVADGRLLTRSRLDAMLREVEARFAVSAGTSGSAATTPP